MTPRPMVLALVLGLLALSPLEAALPETGPCRPEVQAFRKAESERAARLLAVLSDPLKYGVQPRQEVDILLTDLDLRLDPGARRIAGTVTFTFRPTASLSRLKLRLHRALSLGPCRLDGALQAVKRKKDDLTFAFTPALPAGTEHTLSVAYQGTPVVSGALGGGMFFSEHDGVPSATTLSEPFDSYAWWPCVDDVADKALARIRLTVPSGMVGASNGTLESHTVNGDGTETWTWFEGYPIANYLIAANVTNYALFTDVYTALDGLTAMPLLHFVYPEDEAAARVNFSRVPEMIGWMAQSCGEYPFLAEKYGMVAFPWGGGMEHQTLTSMGDRFVGGFGNYDEIYVHELAHQWWGDDVTCGTWNDVWLNEGFATYFEALWIAREEHRSMGEVMAYYDDGRYDGYLGGAVYLKDGDTAFTDTGAIYDKGAWVLHMLRYVVGDDAFFSALRAYRAAHAYGNATTEDLRAAFEAAAGRDLSWFFEQWVYTPKRPVYRVSWSPVSGGVSVTVEQRQKHRIARRTTLRDTYIMPLEVTLHYTDGSAETLSVWNDQRSQTFTLPASKAVASVGLDEGNHLLKVLQ
ncbi:MAG: M1 family metallopeptidase [Acidobacteriota bacterium]